MIYYNKVGEYMEKILFVILTISILTILTGCKNRIEPCQATNIIQQNTSN